jgi:tRNA threonylcarbamoyladenosine biosynthesis protein TsaB
MNDCNLAIETASHEGWITLGRGDAILETAPLPRQRRHNIELMPAIDALCQKHRITRRDLTELYVSLGPGSFTGLRIALATIKALAMARPVRVVGVASLDVVARNAPDEARHVAVGLNLKRGTLHSQIFARAGDGSWQPAGDARLRTAEELLDEAPRPVALLAEKLPPLPPAIQNDPDVTILDPQQAAPRSEVLWQLGRARAKAGQFNNPLELSPLYIREPEAVTLWRENQPAREQR